MKKDREKSTVFSFSVITVLFLSITNAIDYLVNLKEELILVNSFIILILVLGWAFCLTWEKTDQRLKFKWNWETGSHSVTLAMVLSFLAFVPIVVSALLELFP